MLKRHLLFFLAALFSILASCAFANTAALLHQPGDPVAGNPRGKVTVVEFFDYQCGHCTSMAPVVDAIVRANPNVRVVFKELPIRGPMSELASRAALAANKQGKYNQFRHAILSTNQPLSETVIFELAKASGLNVERLKHDMNSAAVRRQIQANYQLARALQVTGTPAFFIAKTGESANGNVNFVLGEMSQSELQNAIDNANKS